MLLKRLFGNTSLVVVDEAQNVRNIGKTLKVIHDSMPDIQVIATGSSSFALGNSLNEPLTGRGVEFILYPFSLKELEGLYKPHEIDPQMAFFLRFGLYPEILDQTEDRAGILIENLADKYLYKDILALENLRKPELLTSLLQLLAFQIGSEVSRNELAVRLNTSRETVERYLDLLEKTFVIFRLKPLARNQRNEIARKEKIYFYDLGIRNSIISSFQPLEKRNDTGALFENLMILERLKHLEYLGQNPKPWFWRTHDQKEIDYLEESGGRFRAFEFKWGKGDI
ncbi:MAG: ATP-binding protein [Spirochaetales bacterium]|nr:ATP-binding protein [Spirochaetales bacterium]